MPKPSQVIFAIIGLLSLVFGVIYVLLPMASYHEGMVGMTAAELAEGYPEIYGLLTTLVDVAGLTFLALGIFILWVGSRAWKEKGSWMTILAVFIVCVLPMTYVVGSAGGPLVVMGIVAALCFAGLVLSRLGS